MLGACTRLGQRLGLRTPSARACRAVTHATAAAMYQTTARVATTTMLARTACVMLVVHMDPKRTSIVVARRVHGRSSSVTDPFTRGNTSNGMASIEKSRHVGKRVDLVTHAHDGALGPGNCATHISFNTIGCTFRARDDDSNNQGGNVVPTTHDTVNVIGGASANIMDLGGG
ncbi:hypothetical protein GUJ93_ZPchr0011g27123 [Zizania palustris]|uniref:Uncharacterized protein n=1 Tax=Zizania palustris TaxID=103762 RepID=A0A8J5WKA1_ZIZPA|nr:hypothetical protein GUJ93_ZPchr0011g27123 [Zizania palustris]